MKQEEQTNIEEIDQEEILKSVQLKEDDDPIEEPTKVVNEVRTEIIDKEVPLIEDEEATKALHSDFSSFLETKADIVPDEGVKIVIPTGIDLVDAILGGGFIVGGLCIIVGQPGSGKTMLAIQTLAQGQRQFRGNMLGAFLDSEEATTTQRMANLGVRYPTLKPYTDMTVEKVFKFLEGLSVFKKERKLTHIPSAVIWDSIANTLSQKEREAEDINSVIGYKARMLSILIPKYVAKCAQNNICLLAVNQLREVLQMGPFAGPRDLKFMTASRDMPGGQVLKYNAFQLVEMKIKSVIDPAKMGFEGVIAKVKCVKNKLFTPNVEVEIVGNFLTGFSNFWTNYNFLASVKRLETGAWNYLVDLPDKKFRTKDAETLYKTEKDFKDAFDKAAKETIQTEIIQKYSTIIE